MISDGTKTDFYNNLVSNVSFTIQTIQLINSINDKHNSNGFRFKMNKYNFILNVLN